MVTPPIFSKQFLPFILTWRVVPIMEHLSEDHEICQETRAAWVDHLNIIFTNIPGCIHWVDLNIYFSSVLSVPSVLCISALFLESLCFLCYSDSDEWVNPSLSPTLLLPY